MRRGLPTICARKHRGLRRPADGHGNSRAGNPTRPICWKRRGAAMCCGASRPASCCPPRMRSTANSASSRALHAQGFPVPRAVRLLRRRERRRHRVLCDGFRRRPRVLGAAHAGLEPGGARRRLRRDERDAGAAALLRSGGDRAWPISAAAKTMSRGRSSAGRSNIAPRRPRPIDEMDRLIAWLPRNVPPQPAGAARAWRLPARQHDRRADAPDIIAVLDWELSTLGDPLADFTYHLMQWHMPHSESRAGTGSLVGRDLRARHSVAVGLCRSLCGAHRARSAPASAGLSRLQFLPHRRDPAGHHRAGARRHRDQRARARQGRMIRPLAEKAWAFAQEARCTMKTRRARARRRRCARACAYRRARGPRRDGHPAGRHRRHLDRRADRRRLMRPA